MENTPNKDAEYNGILYFCAKLQNETLILRHSSAVFFGCGLFQVQTEGDSFGQGNVRSDDRGVYLGQLPEQYAH